MARTRIKFCGMTRPADALAAVEAGADAIGLVFHPPSRRNLSPERARDIIRALPPFVTPVGLFVDADLHHVLRIADQLELRHVQFNGHETPQYVSQFQGLRVLKAVRMSRATAMTELTAFRIMFHQGTSSLTGILLETPNTNHFGGAGVANDWSFIAELQRGGAFIGMPPLVAAGGLTPESVGDVVRRLRPFGVDVSTGVESSLGIKSAEKLRAFVQAVREADAAPDA